MAEARTSYGETGRLNKLAAVSAAGMLAVTAAAGNLARTADAAPSHAASAEVGEKSRNWLMGWMDGKMVLAVKDMQKLKASHQGAVQERLVKISGHELTQYEIRLAEPNTLSERSYTFLIIRVEEGQKVPDSIQFIPNNPSPHLNLSPEARHPNMGVVKRELGADGYYSLDFSDPSGKKQAPYRMNANRPPTTDDERVYEDFASLVFGFIELKKDSYKKSPAA